MRSKILAIDSAGGGIYIYEALATAAKMIAPAKAGTRHIILFADAADSEEPGDYKTLVPQCAKAGITISVVGLGTEHDCDAELLKDIARRGGGQCMFTNVAQELPRLFAQDTFLIARSAFLEDPVAVRSTGGLLGHHAAAAGRLSRAWADTTCVTCGPSANLAVVSRRRVPGADAGRVAGRLGPGAVLCGRGRREIHRRHGRLEKRRRFLRLAGPLDGRQSHRARARAWWPPQELRNGVCRVELHLDPARQTTPFSGLPELTTLSARPGETAVPRRPA